jgi:hypothetical protein
MIMAQGDLLTTVSEYLRKSKKMSVFAVLLTEWLQQLTSIYLEKRKEVLK